MIPDRKPRTTFGIAEYKQRLAQNKARRQRKAEAKRLNCLENEVLDRKAEEIWNRNYAQQEREYYETEFATSALKRRTQAPPPTTSRMRIALCGYIAENTRCLNPGLRFRGKRVADMDRKTMAGDARTPVKKGFGSALIA